MSEDVTKLLAQFDQEHAELRETSVLVGEYYGMLRRSGTPFILAILIVRDWHKWLWHEAQ